jgi:hypothetical protein
MQVTNHSHSLIKCMKQQLNCFLLPTIRHYIVCKTPKGHHSLFSIFPPKHPLFFLLPFAKSVGMALLVRCIYFCLSQSHVLNSIFFLMQHFGRSYYITVYIYYIIFFLFLHKLVGYDIGELSNSKAGIGGTAIVK